MPSTSSVRVSESALSRADALAVDLDRDPLMSLLHGPRVSRARVVSLALHYGLPMVRASLAYARRSQGVDDARDRTALDFLGALARGVHLSLALDESEAPTLRPPGRSCAPVVALALVERSREVKRRASMVQTRVSAARVDPDLVSAALVDLTAEVQAMLQELADLTP